MKQVLLIISFFALASCANNRQQAFQTLCKGVNSTGRACSSAVGLPGKCADCIRENQQIELEQNKEPDITTLESKENSMLW